MGILPGVVTAKSLEPHAAARNDFFLPSPPLPPRVAEKEPINKMSLHNLATVFGPTLLRPSEVESKAHLTSAADIWSHDVMAQVPTHCPGLRLLEGRDKPP